MPTREIVARQLPFMRRFARAAAGDQVRGDACVRQALEELLKSGALTNGESPRVAMFRAIIGCLDCDETNEKAFSQPVADGAIVDQRVHRLTMRHRQALLMSLLEGFSDSEIAGVLGIAADEVTSLLAEAKVDLRDQRPTRILIIEDEPIIALDLAGIVGRNGHEVVGIAATRAEAVDLARRHKPGLILADIQLADDSSGIDAVQMIMREHVTPVIFITAFPERLLTGERPEPTFLITKPFDADTLNVSISQALATSHV